MGTTEFFESCYKCAQERYKQVLAKPTLAKTYVGHYKQLMQNLNTAINYGEISPQAGFDLKERFKQLDYTAYKERMKKL